MNPKVPSKPAVKSLTHPLHFDDLGGKNFERLCHRYLQKILPGFSVQWLGETGSDGGRDILATNAGDIHCYQCANYKRFTFSKVQVDVDKVLGAREQPTRFVMIWSSAITSKSREKIINYIKRKGIRDVEVWSGAELEGKIRTEAPEILQDFFKGVDVVPPPKPKKYRFRTDYIPRVLQQYNEETGSFGKHHSLKDLCSTRSRIIVLSPGGMGKTSELEHIAETLSQDGSTHQPILIRLNIYHGEEISELISKELPGWDQMDPAGLIFIFDGLDEVHISHKELVERKLIAFGLDERFRRGKILVSCRDNMYNPAFEESHGDQEPFLPVKLEELTVFVVHRHILKVLGEERGNVFLKQVKERQIQDIIKNPFFLHYLLDLYRDDDLPNSKVEIFERLIEHRVRRDHQRTATNGLKLSQNQVMIEDEIQRIALIMETMGTNFVSDKDFQKIVPDYEGKRVLLEHSFLFDRLKPGEWQFEHNNFQEYLAAKALSSFALETIKKFVAVPPTYERVKDSWVNALSFLFLLLPDGATRRQEFIEWLSGPNPEVVLRFERSRIDLVTREQIFRRILSDYHDKGIPARGGKLEFKNLVEFVSDSRKILDEQIAKIKSPPNEVILVDALRMVSYFEFVQERRTTLEPMLKSGILAPASSEMIRYSYVQALSGLRWQSQDLLTEVLKRLDLNVSAYDRAGVYKLLIGSGLLDENIDLVIQLIAKPTAGYFYSNRSSQKKIHLGDETILRNECIEAVVSPPGLKKLIDFFSVSIRAYENDDLVRRHLSTVLDASVDAFLSGQKEAFEPVYSFFKTIALLQDQRYYEHFRDFFTKVHMLQDTAMRLYNEGIKEDTATAIGVLADKSFVDFLVNEYKEGRLRSEAAGRLLKELLYLKPKSEHDLLYAELNKVSNNQFAYPPTENWSEISKKRYQRDLDLIMDKESFLEGIRKVFELAETDVLSKKKINEMFALYWRGKEKRLDNSISIYTLDKIVGEHISLKHALGKFSNPADWEWFQIATLKRYDVENTIELSDREIKFIKCWCDKTLLSFDFRNSYTFGGVYLTYFIWRFDFEYSDDVYLQLLWQYGSDLPSKRKANERESEWEKFPAWLERKVGDRKLKTAITANLKVGVKVLTVFRNHIALMRKYKLKDGAYLLPPYFESGIMSRYELVSVVDDYLELGGDFAKVEYLLTDQRLSKEEWTLLIDTFIKFKVPKVKEHLRHELSLAQAEGTDGFEFAKKLMMVGDIEGLKYYRDWIADHKAFDDWVGVQHYRNLPDEEALPVFLDIVETTLKPGFNWEAVHSQESDLFYVLISLASRSEKSYQFVRQGLLDLVSKYNVPSIHFEIQKLDDQYYTRLGQSLTLPEAIRFVESQYRGTLRGNA